MHSLSAVPVRGRGQSFPVPTLLHGLGSPNRYGYLASAYGQMYAWKQELHASDKELGDVRKKALEAAKRAVALSSGWKEVIAGLLDPSLPGADPNDNDLDVFKDDPEFRALAGLEPVPPAKTP